MKQNHVVHTGNRIAVLLDGREVGLLQSVTPNDDYSPEPASGIGDIEVKEYVPTMARHTLSVSSMVLRAGSLRELGLIPENGEAMLRGLVFDFEVFSKDDGTRLRKYTGCSYASGSLEIRKHSIVMESGQFNALSASN